MFCDNTTCKYNQLGMECTKVPYNIEFYCNDRNTNFNEKGTDKSSENINNEKM